ncbi:hypothetical protein [Demequina sp. SO4-18]|uniref:hypothetical protein n=1 Tax=Demequina sp. SO4-18 TaxID=3401026 RepID=UPI003B59CDC9
MTNSDTQTTLPPETQDRVREILHAGLRLQLTRDPIEAARAALEPGGSLSFYVLAQCKWRGLDPAPYLEEIGVETIGTEPVTCTAHRAKSGGEAITHLELTDCVETVPAGDGLRPPFSDGSV